jgi:hypothetical protein
MNPRSKGWLKDYLQFRQHLFLEIRGGGHRASHPDFSVYKVLQPTGLLYGQPVTPLEFSEATAWSAKDKLKVLLAESLICSSLLNEQESGSENISPVLIRTLESINAYYQHVFPELSATSRTFLGKKKDTLTLAEEIFERRVEKMDLKGPFWVRFFHASLLFLDVFIFGQWMRMETDKLVSDYFHYEREELRTSVVRVMAAAAHANHNVAFEERKLLEYFLESAQLSAEQKKECRDIFENGIAVEELGLHTGNSWLLKKYLLEIAILTFWADRKVEETEMALLNRLAEAQMLHKEDVDNSLLAVEGFVLEHWVELDTLQDKKSFDDVSAQFIQRMAAIAARNRNKLLADAKADQKLVSLLRSGRSTELNEEDKESLRECFIDLLKRIPMFAMISLPRHFLSLPVLTQILPRNFIPDVLDGVK